MKLAGALLIILGAIGIVLGVRMGTTVAAGDMHVYNHGLLANRQAVLAMGGAAFIGGAILAAIPTGQRKS